MSVRLVVPVRRAQLEVALRPSIVVTSVMGVPARATSAWLESK